MALPVCSPGLRACSSLDAHPFCISPLSSSLLSPRGLFDKVVCDIVFSSMAFLILMAASFVHAFYVLADIVPVFCILIFCTGLSAAESSHRPCTTPV